MHLKSIISIVDSCRNFDKRLLWLDAEDNVFAFHCYPLFHLQHNKHLKTSSYMKFNKCLAIQWILLRMFREIRLRWRRFSNMYIFGINCMKSNDSAPIPESVTYVAEIRARNWRQILHHFALWYFDCTSYTWMRHTQFGLLTFNIKLTHS